MKCPECGERAIFIAGIDGAADALECQSCGWQLAAPAGTHFADYFEQKYEDALSDIDYSKAGNNELIGYPLDEILNGMADNPLLFGTIDPDDMTDPANNNLLE